MLRLLRHRCCLFRRLRALYAQRVYLPHHLLQSIMNHSMYRYSILPFKRFAHHAHFKRRAAAVDVKLASQSRVRRTPTFVHALRAHVLHSYVLCV